MTTEEIQLLNPRIKVSCLYKITSPVSGHYYYGSTKNLRNRYLHGHLHRLQNHTHENKFMQRVYDKYPGNWTVEILKLVEPDKKLLQESEQPYLDKHFGQDLCMNISKSAFRSSGSEGRIISEKTRDKMRVSHIGKKQSPEYVAKRFAARAGYRHSRETKLRMSATKTLTRLNRQRLVCFFACLGHYYGFCFNHWQSSSGSN